MSLLLVLLILLLLLLALLLDLARPHFCFISALMALLVTGQLSPAQAFSGFSNESVFTVGALFVVAAGIKRTEALSILDRIVFTETVTPRQLMFRMMAGTSVFSAFLNNTPIVAMLIPKVNSWAERRKLSPSRFLLPLSYAASVGGIITIIGTSTNLIVSSVIVEKGHSPLSFFELSYIGIPVTLLSILWFYFAGYRMLPGYKVKKEQSKTDGKSFQFDLVVTTHSPIVGHTIASAGLRELDDLFLLHIYRGDYIIGPVSPDQPIQAGDILSFTGLYEVMTRLAKEKKLDWDLPSKHQQRQSLPMYEAVVSNSSDMIGYSFKELGFRDRFNGVVIAIQRKDEIIKGALGKIPIKAGDMLLIEAGKDFEHLSNSTHFYMVRRKGIAEHNSEKGKKTALFIMVSMIISAATGLLPMVTLSILAALAMLALGYVKKEELLSSVQIPILLVIASAIGIGKAIEVSGLATYGSNLLATLTQSNHPILIVLAVYLMTNLFTEFITNNAAAVLMLPMGLELSLSANINPHGIAVTIAVAASASFLTPIGYQTNLMVMGAGGYKFTDYLKAGFPLTIIMMFVTLGVVWLRYL
jgi:di/tricarboxylate transporter